MYRPFSRLRDFVKFGLVPGVETPGYDQGSGGHPWLPVRRHPCRESTAAWSGLNGIA
jgi:hypothetical protein